VHSEVRHYAARGDTIFLIGHAGHEEVEGTTGEAPDSVVLVESVADAERVEAADRTRVACVTQTTLSVDETTEILAVLRRRFPALRAPRTDDICYATSNRQAAVKALADEVELVLVIGSANSSNSKRLVEVARGCGVRAYLIEDETEIAAAWLADVEAVGITSGASAPESLVRRVVSWFQARGVTDVRSRPYVREDLTFKLPVELRSRGLSDAGR
jgi:4-hydroxy-3-methylbut-2-enyl diphosphate reductase